MSYIKNNEVLRSIIYAKENNIFDDLNNLYNTLPDGKCNGCGECCMESVKINLVEFLYIFDYLHTRPLLKFESYNKIIDYFFLEYLMKKPCPFRKDNKCSIYKVRPLNCRIYGHWTKADYEQNLKIVINKNIYNKRALSKYYGINISDEVVNFKINYCDKFTPNTKYLTKSERLSFYDELFNIDTKIFRSGKIYIEYEDRGVVEYFIETMIDSNIAYKIRRKIIFCDIYRYRTIDRIKRLFLV